MAVTMSIGCHSISCNRRVHKVIDQSDLIVVMEILQKDRFSSCTEIEGKGCIVGAIYL
jgi:hypothetical protein